MGRNALGQLYHSPWGRQAGRSTHRALDRIERRATRGRGPAARAAARYLVRGMVTGHSYTDAEPVLRILYAARDPRVAELARAGLDRAWAAGTPARAGVWHAIWQLVGSRERRRAYGSKLTGPLPAAARDFLLTPDPAARHEPGIRLVAAFDDARVAWKPEADTVVEAAVRFDDRALADVLGRTDQPDLLAAIESAFSRSLRSADHTLWTNEPLLAVLRASPVLPRPPAEAHDPTAGALLAVVMDRPDLLHGHDEWQLFMRARDVLRGDPPADVAARLRWVLRRPGPMAGVIRRSAMNGDEVALAVWEETGGHTTDPHWHAAHLFWTGDWAGYDRLDPDGRLLREFLAGPSYDDPRITGPVHVAGRFREIARREGRPDPLPPAKPRTDPGPTRNRYPGGSWPTSYTGHF